MTTLTTDKDKLVSALGLLNNVLDSCANSVGGDWKHGDLKTAVNDGSVDWKVINSLCVSNGVKFAKDYLNPSFEIKGGSKESLLGNMSNAASALVAVIQLIDSEQEQPTKPKRKGVKAKRPLGNAAILQAADKEEELEEQLEIPEVPPAIEEQKQETVKLRCCHCFGEADTLTKVRVGNLSFGVCDRCMSLNKSVKVAADGGHKKSGKKNDLNKAAQVFVGRVLGQSWTTIQDDLGDNVGVTVSKNMMTKVSQLIKLMDDDAYHALAKMIYDADKKGGNNWWDLSYLAIDAVDTDKTKVELNELAKGLDNKPTALDLFK